MQSLLRFFLLVILIILSLHCKKKEVLPFYMNSTFQTENTTSVDRVRLFARSGEIMDTQFIRNFIDRKTTQAGFPNHFLFGISSESLDPNMHMKISFRENYTARVERYTYYYLPSNWEIHEAGFISTNPDELLVTEIDSVMSLDLATECGNLMKSLLSYTPVANCIPTSGSQEYCKWKYFFPVSIQNNEVTISMINRLVVKNNTNPGVYCMYNIWAHTRNTFKASIVGTLGTNDTIAIQIKRVTLQKL